VVRKLKEKWQPGQGPGAEAKAEVGIPVDLTPVYNCSTSHSIFRKFPTDNLGSFPIGTNGFGGIRFVVSGMIQLGGSYPNNHRLYPCQDLWRHDTLNIGLDGGLR